MFRRSPATSPRDAPELPSKASNHIDAPDTANSIVGIVSGTGYVIERLHPDGTTRDVMPLAAFAVTADLELKPLPASLTADWVVRPQSAGDERLINTTTARMHPQPQRQDMYL